MYRTIMIAPVVALMLSLSAAHAGSCSADGATASTHHHDIVDTAAKAGSFNTLLAAAKAAGLVDTLKGPGPYTVFAPTDKAFSQLPEGTVASLLKAENRGLLKAILTYHVVSGKVMAKDAVKLSAARTVNGQQVNITTQDGKVMIDNATVTATDIAASNGVIHVIDRVIMPSSQDIIATAVEAGSFKTLAAAIEAAGLVSTLQGDGPFTVFAPTDQAFAKLPEGTVASLLEPANRKKLQVVLTYHVVAGRVFSDQALAAGSAKTIEGNALVIEKKASGVYINGARLVKADIDAANGVIHVIDSVLLPPTDATAMTTTP